LTKWVKHGSLLWAAGLVGRGWSGRGLTPRPPDACGEGIVGRESILAAGAGDVFR
jgi:hypothetical protein